MALVGPVKKNQKNNQINSESKQHVYKNSHIHMNVRTHASSYPAMS